MSAFGNELTRLMTARGIGVHEFARMSHYSAGYISNLRSGKKTPAPEAAAEFDALLQANGQLIATLSTPGAGAPDGRPFLDELTNHAIELGKWAEAGNVGDGTVEQLDDAIQRIARDHLSSPLEPLIRRASDISHRILEFLREHQRLRQRLAPVLALPPEMRLATFDDKLSRTHSLLGSHACHGSAVARDLAGEISDYLAQRQIEAVPYPIGD